MVTLKVTRLRHADAWKDFVLIPNEHRIDSKGNEITRGTVCRISVGRGNKRKSDWVIVAGLDSEEPEISLDLNVRTALGVAIDETRDFELTPLSWFARLWFPWRASDPGYRIPAQLGLISFVLGLIGVVLGILAIVPHKEPQRTPILANHSAPTVPISPHATDYVMTAGSLPVKRVGPAKLYPDSKITIGKSDTLNADDLTRRYTENCPGGKEDCTYSQSHRNVPAGERTAVYDNYQVPVGKRKILYGEVDHLYPLCAGGSNDITNLWYQPADEKWNGKNYGYHQKDELEAWVCRQIKVGKLTPKDAYNRLTQDWVKFYLDEGLDNAQEGDEDDTD